MQRLTLSLPTLKYIDSFLPAATNLCSYLETSVAVLYERRVVAAGRNEPAVKNDAVKESFLRDCRP